MSHVSTSPASPAFETATPPRSHRGLRQTIPNVIVFSLLVAVLAFGHHTGWKMPKASDLYGATAAVAPDWCTDHLVPESICFECQVSQGPKPKEFGFCRIHGVMECVTCHPELAEVAGQPQLPSYDTAKAITVLPRPENNSRNILHKRRVQFTTAASAEKAGVDVDVVQERPMTDAIRANGELVFDPTRVTHLSPKVAGTVAHVFKTLGDEVQPGDTLALIDAAQVGQAKSQLLHAVVQLQLKHTNVKRMRSAADSLSARAVIEAEAAFEEAEIAFISARQALVNLGFDVPEELEARDAKKISDDLRFLGIAPSLVEALPKGTMTATLIPIKAPYSGAIITADVVAGEVVDTTKPLFMVADPTRLWLLLSVRQEDARFISRGLPVVFHTDDRSQDVRGTIGWLSPAVDEHTRTLQVRINIDNPSETLRDKTFGAGQIVLREEPKAVTVPRGAVQSTSDANFVFVRDRNYLKEGAPKMFHVRQVRLGAKDDSHVEILAGVLPGEVIATKGSNVLLAQLLRSNLGAGCCDHHH